MLQPKMESQSVHTTTLPSLAGSKVKTMSNGSKKSKKQQYIESLNQWYATQDERLITPQSIEDMAKAYENEIVSEGRIHLSKLITKE
jgi:hypothetical protein